MNIGKQILMNPTNRKSCINCGYCNVIMKDFKTGEYHRFCDLGKKITPNKIQRGCTYFYRRNRDE